jgi:hypothetical protein
MGNTIGQNFLELRSLAPGSRGGVWPSWAAAGLGPMAA